MEVQVLHQVDHVDDFGREDGFKFLRGEDKFAAEDVLLGNGAGEGACQQGWVAPGKVPKDEFGEQVENLCGREAWS